MRRLRTALVVLIAVSTLVLMAGCGGSSSPGTADNVWEGAIWDQSEWN